jgi:histidinol dehydrogenase
MRVILASNVRALASLSSTDEARDVRVVRTALRIVTDVERRGDAALAYWANRLDGVRPPFEIPRRAWHAGWAATPRAVRDAIRLAVRHLSSVARRELPRGFSRAVRPGLRIEARVTPLGRVGCYVPGGRHPLPSTLLMTVVPAREAGVADIVVACPRPTPEVLCAALEAGAGTVLQIGGPQAIAALAYGTASIARVDKIVGPGGAWVAAAKTIVSASCAIDMHAGPSEVVIYADRGGTARADWIAADLVAQAEHDPAARAIFVTTRPDLARAVRGAALRQAPPRGTAARSLRRHGAVVLARSRAEALAVVNRLAPEHVACDTAEDARAITTAGTVFVGRWTAPALGDYVTGSNHVLPTGRAARARGGLSAADFVRVSTVQTMTRRALAAVGPAAVALARAEGLDAHAASVERRLR